jgi:hypothetical protein
LEKKINEKKEKIGKLKKKEKKREKLAKKKKEREESLWITVVIHSDLGVGEQ